MRLAPCSSRSGAVFPTSPPLRRKHATALIAGMSSIPVHPPARPQHRNGERSARVPAGVHCHLVEDVQRDRLRSTVGPDGMLYVTDPTHGHILRVDPATGSCTVFAPGLPKTP